MRRLSDHQHHILTVVNKHGRICIGLPVDAEWAPIAAELRQLAKWRFLIEEATDDGPAYELAPAGLGEAGEIAPGHLSTPTESP